MAKADPKPTKARSAPPLRVTTYTQEKGDAICERIANGESLRKVCRSPGFPTKTTVLKWLREQPAFAAHYARAREEQADDAADEMTEIRRRVMLPAFIKNPDWEEGMPKALKWLPNPDKLDAQDARAAIDAIKWETAKRNPKKYGDKLAIEVSNNDPAALLAEFRALQAQTGLDLLGLDQFMALPAPTEP